jgi:hypothetical protein
MTVKETVEKRLEELIEGGMSIKNTARGSGFEASVDSDRANQWVLSVLTIIGSALGKECESYLWIKKNKTNCNSPYVFDANLSYLKATLEDFKGGYFFDKRALIEAEVFDDLFEQAKELLSSGYKDAAAVLVGAALDLKQANLDSLFG